MVKGNIYRFFSQGKLSQVVGVSSSCLYESPFFDTNSFFLGNRRNLGSIIYGNFNTFSFWENVFTALKVPFQGKQFPEITYSSNTLRNSLDAWWGQNSADSILPDMNNNSLRELCNIRNTISWKITAPLRFVGRVIDDIRK